MNRFQRAIIRLVAPKTLRKNRSARSYQGALISRLTADWRSSQLSPDAEVRQGLRKFRFSKFRKTEENSPKGFNYSSDRNRGVQRGEMRGG